ncbi:MAG: AAA family ATPase, partial [Planctomycetota bacterium]
MRLAKLTLTGFKSFADQTEFRFDTPVTGIVGPNGCGKSNVVDAIKWVLGERSAKSLRGKEMADVIFAGSAGRKPGGLASVVLTFENPLLSEDAYAKIEASRVTELELAAPEEDQASKEEPEDSVEEASDKPVAIVEPKPARQRPRRALALDAEMVDVERRLYRDGTSQYLINGRKVRLRDIRELFMDTGVGAHAYSIIEQGKVDAMLLASTVERRVFFEEAAGVAKFKVRRIESIRKLERTQANLVRTREQLESTERRLRIVKGQAAKARKFKEFDEELSALRMALAFDQYHDLTERLTGLTSRLCELDEDRNDAMDAVANAEQGKQEAEAVRAELSAEHQRLEREKTAAEHRAEQAQQRQHMSERAMREAE